MPARQKELFPKRDSPPLADGPNDGKASLKLSDEVVVRLGVGMAMMPDDIHSTAVEGVALIPHLHMYGEHLDTITDRLEFDLEAGTVGRFNDKSGSAVSDPA